MLTAEDIHAIFGEHHARAVHAKGVVLEATFEPTEEARELSKAIVFADKSQATVRLSDTTGIPEIPDATRQAIRCFSRSDRGSCRR